MLVGGVYCLMTPIATYAALSWLIGLAMVVEGVGSAVTWGRRRALGLADGWTLVGAVISIILGAILLVSFAAQFAVDMFIAYLIAAWLVVGGITRIVAAMGIRSHNLDPRNEPVPVNWGLLLVMGILVVILGVLCLFNPLSVMVGVGTILGVSIIFVGVDIIAHGIQM